MGKPKFVQTRRCAWAAALLIVGAWTCGSAGAQESTGDESTAYSSVEEGELDGSNPLVVVTPAAEGLPSYYALPWNRPLSLKVEYLHTWLSAGHYPALATTAPVGDVPALGMPSTSLLFGDENVAGGARGGIRGTLGVRLGQWVDTDWEFDAQFMWIGDGQDSADFLATSTGSPVLGRPFFNADTGMQDAVVVAEPGLLFVDPLTGMVDATLELDSASLQVASTSDMIGVGGLFRHRWFDSGNVWWDVLVGYRFLRFREGMDIIQFQEFTDPNASSRVASNLVIDSFSTASEFHGADLGVSGHWQHGPMRIELLMKLSLGNMHQSLDVAGATLSEWPSGSGTNVFAAASGLLAGPSNIGHFRSDQFQVVPEFGVTLRRNLTSQFAVTFGYTLIAMPGVLRAGDSIDTTIDPTGTLPRPGTTLDDSVLVLHSLTAGVEW